MRGCYTPPATTATNDSDGQVILVLTKQHFDSDTNKGVLGSAHPFRVFPVRRRDASHG
jgi:hypothetical protein